MIVHQAADRLRIVTQNDHAHFAAELLRFWRADGLPDHPRRRDLLTATREHDNGWREADSAPRIDPATGKPLGFVEIDDALRLEIWRIGMLRHRDDDPLVALYIAEHARALHPAPEEALRQERPDLYLLAEEAAALRGELLEETGLSEAELRADYRFLAVADRLSLIAAGGWDGPFEAPGLRGEHGAGRLRVEPFPWAGTTTFRLPCRFVPDRAYADATHLAVELAPARWTEVMVQGAPSLSDG